ncbi:MAG TPA: response regulator [Methanospirillum sp.]|uniref:response regulator n=1 Tax=Methanospirillum sp. TaxID=45200 RepID=UPI002BC2CDED|nr:response regulator [Methanospirillum sp.]HWQ64769.1 response regulator [Methanospirillum sp.]
MARSDAGLELILIEDSPNDAELFLNVVEWIDMGDQVRVFPDGREALEYLLGTGKYEGQAQEYPVVIFLDLKMPLIDGIEVLKALKENPRSVTHPVVVFTSSNQDIDVVKSYQLGANSYVVKPVQFEKYAETIRELINYWRNMNRPMVHTGN